LTQPGNTSSSELKKQIKTAPSDGNAAVVVLLNDYKQKLETEPLFQLKFPTLQL
jgi:hypothetical protein